MGGKTFLRVNQIITELSVSYLCKWQCFFTEETKQAKGAAALSSVFSQLMLGKTIRPDFNIEEKASVEKDKREIKKIIHEIITQKITILKTNDTH